METGTAGSVEVGICVVAVGDGVVKTCNLNEAGSPTCLFITSTKVTPEQVRLLH